MRPDILTLVLVIDITGWVKGVLILKAMLTFDTLLFHGKFLVAICSAILASLTDLRDILPVGTCLPNPSP